MVVCLVVVSCNEATASMDEPTRMASCACPLLHKNCSMSSSDWTACLYVCIFRGGGSFESVNRFSESWWTQSRIAS